MESKCKRLRLDTNKEGPDLFKKEPLKTNMEIRSILADEYTREVETTKVIVGTITDTKTISNLIDQLSSHLPLEDLQHLKRVRKNQIILCKNDAIERDLEKTGHHKKDLTLQFLLKQGLDADLSTNLCHNVSVAEVASTQPTLRWQYEKMNRFWPCKFHPNKYLETLYANTNFKEKEKEFHMKIMLAVQLLARAEFSNMAGICVDPRTPSIVATASSQTDISPLLHCPMVLTDMVARTQNGGVWNYTNIEFEENTDKLNFAGISNVHHKILNENFENLTFGAEKIELDRKFVDAECTDDNLTKYGPYLCTGYDVYLLKEPCLMCAMALVHSRVKRIFYMEATERGGLATLLKLHTVKDLNHHFEVFQIVERGEAGRDGSSY